MGGQSHFMKWGQFAHQMFSLYNEAMNKSWAKSPTQDVRRATVKTKIAKKIEFLTENTKNYSNLGQIMLKSLV